MFVFFTYCCIGYKLRYTYIIPTEFYMFLLFISGKFTEKRGEPRPEDGNTICKLRCNTYSLDNILYQDVVSQVSSTNKENPTRFIDRNVGQDALFLAAGVSCLRD